MGLAVRDLDKSAMVTKAQLVDLRLAAPRGATGACTTALCFGSCIGDMIGLGVRQIDWFCIWGGKEALVEGVAGVCCAILFLVFGGLCVPRGAFRLLW